MPKDETAVLEVKNYILTHGNDSIAFEIRKGQFNHEVTYYFNSPFGKHVEVKQCNNTEAQDRFHKAIRDGYKIAF